MGEEILNAIKAKNKVGLQALLDKELNVNKFSYYALRLLNKYGYKGGSNPSTYAYIIEQLERIGDAYTELIQFLLKLNTNVNKSVLNLISKTNLLFKKCHEATFDLTKDKAVSMSMLHRELNKELNESLNTKSLAELKVFFSLKEIRAESINILGIQLGLIKDL